MTATSLYETFVDRMRQMVDALPRESAGVREQRRLLETLDRDAYWLNVDQAKAQVLKLEVAPLMRYLPGVDLATATFEIHCLECITALLRNETDKAVKIARTIREDVIRLPVEHPEVEPIAEAVQERYSEDWCDTVTVDEVLAIWDAFRDVMQHRLTEPTTIISLDLADAVKERWVEVGPHGDRFEVTEYQDKVIERVRDLAAAGGAVTKVASDEPITDAELAELQDQLNQPELFASEEALRKAWRAPHASLVAILRHILGVEALETREAAINGAFSSFLRTKNYLQAEQLTFVRLFARRLIDVGTVGEADLYEAPFTDLAADPTSLLPADDLEELFDIATKLGLPDA